MPDIGDISFQLKADIGDTLSQLNELVAAIDKVGEAPDTSAVVGAIDKIGEVAKDTETPLTGLQTLILELVSTGEATSALDGLAMAIKAVGEGADTRGLTEGASEIDQVSAGVGGAVEGVTALGGAAEAASAQMNLFGEAVNIPFAEADGQLNMFTDDIQVLAGDSQSAAAAVDGLKDAIGGLGGGLEEAATSGKQFSDSAQAIIDRQNELDAALKTAETTLLELKAGYEEGAVSAEALARGISEYDSAASAAGASLHNLADEEKNAGHEAEGAAESVHALKEALQLLGIAISVEAFLEFGKSIVEAVDDMTSARIALTALTGDAEATAETLERLEQLGASDGLSMPGLLQAAKTMSLILPEGTDVVGILNELADVSGTTGRSVESLAGIFDRLEQATTVAPRQLSQLGLSMKDLQQAFEETGASAETSAQTVKKAWAELGDNDKMVVLQTALLKLKGVQKDIADQTISGVWAQAMAQWDKDITTMTKDLGGLGDLGANVKSAVNDIAAAFVWVASHFKAMIDSMSGDAAAIVTRIQGIGTALKDLATGNFSGAAKAMSDASATIAAMEKKTAADVAADLAGGAKVITDIMNQTTAAIKTVIPALDNAGKVGKDAGDKIGASFAAAEASVTKFDTLANSGTGGVGALQRAFENASKAINLVAKEDLPLAIKATGDYITAQLALNAPTSVLAAGFAEESKLLNQLGKTDALAASEGFAALTKQLLDAGGNALPLVNAAFTETEKQISALAKTSLPAALDMQEAYNAVLVNSAAPANILNDAFAKTDSILKQMAAGGDLQGAADGFTRLITAEENAGASTAKITQTFQDQQKVFDQMAATGNFQGAIDGLNGLADAEKSFAPNGDAFVKTLQDEQKVLDQMAGTNLQGAIDGLDKLAEKETALNAPAQVVTATLDDERSKLDQLANTDLDKAIQGLDTLAEKQIKLNQPTQDVTKTLDDERSKLDQLANTDLEKAISGLDRLADKQIKLNQPTQDVTKTLDDERSKLDQLANVNLEQAISGLDRLADKQIKLNQPTQDVTKTLDDERSKLDQLANVNLAAAISGLDQLADKQIKLNQPTKDVTATLDDERNKILELGASNVPAAIAALQGLIDKQIALKQPSDDILKSLQDESAMLAKLADTDLPAAIAGHQAYLDGLTKENAIYVAINAEGVKTVQQQEYQIASQKQLLDAVNGVNLAYGDRLALQAKIATEQINLDQAQGKNVENQILGLEKIRLAQEANIIATHGWGDAYVSVINDINKGFDQLGQSMADAIVNGKNLGAALVSEFKKIATSILGDLIQGALQPLKKELLDLEKSLLGAVQPALDTTKGAIDGLANSAKDASDAFPALKKSTDQVSTSMGGFASSLTGWMSAIGAVVGAIAGIVGDVYLAAIDTKLFHVETSLLEIRNETMNRRADAWSQFGSMYDRLGEIEQDTHTMLATLQAMYADGGATGGIGGQAQSDLDTAAANSELLVQSGKDILSAINSLLSPLQSIAGSSNSLAGHLQDIYSFLYVINDSISKVISAINYHGQSNDSANASIMQSESLQAQSNATWGAQVTGAIDGASDRAQTSAHAIVTTEGQIFGATVSVADAALTVADKIAILQNEIAKDNALMRQALDAGDLALAEQYRQAAQNATNKLAPLISATNTGLSQLNTGMSNTLTAVDNAGMYADQAGKLVSTTVVQAAAVISTAVYQAAAITSASFQQTMGAILSSLGGAWGGAGGGLPHGQSGLPSGSGGSTPAYPAPTYTNPGIPTGEQPGYVPGGPLGAYNPGGGGLPNSPAPNYNGIPGAYAPGPGAPVYNPGTGGGLNMGGGGGTQTNLGGTPVNPGSSAGVIPQFGSGGLMPYTGLAHLEKGEWVLTPDEVRASMRFGATSFGSPGAFSSSGQTPSIGTLQNNFYGVQNPQQLAQMVHELVKQAVARAAP